MALTKNIPIIDYFTGANSPSFTITLTKSDGSGALDLSGTPTPTVRCKLRLIGSTGNAFGTTNQGCTISDGANGIVTYQMPVGGLSDPGIYNGQIEVDFGAGVLEYSSKFNLVVDDSL